MVVHSEGSPGFASGAGRSRRQANAENIGQAFRLRQLAVAAWAIHGICLKCAAKP